MFRTKWLGLALVALLVVAAPATAQVPTGNLFVDVTDNEGNALPGATVTVAGQGAPKVQVTNAQGAARFLGLGPGRVGVTAELDGFSTVEAPNVVISVGRNSTLEVSLNPAIEEVITVTSETPLLDEKKISSGTNITQVELEKIPTSRDPWSVLSQTPGVSVDRINVGGAESGQQSSFTAPGVSDDENSFLVDGVEITDMAAVGASSTYYDFDQFTEMQFSTGGTDVTKSAAGVSVNLVTKRGNNEFRGSARIMRTDDNMFDVFTQAVPELTAGDAELANNQSGFIGNSINQAIDYGVEAGGPAIKDRLWVWGSFGVNDIKNRTGGATSAAIQSDDTILENSSFKINAQLGANNSALGSWNNGDKKKFGRNASPTRPQPTTWDQRGPSAIIRFEDTHVFNSNFFLGGHYGKVDGGFQLTSKGVVGAGSLEAAPETVWDQDGIWQNSYLSGGSSRPSEEVNLDANYFFNTGNTSHELKIGGRLRDFETVSPFFWPGRDIFHISGSVFGISDPTVDLVRAHAGQTPLITQEYTSFWAQDTVQTGNLTVNFGFRWDVQDGANEPFSRAANPAFGDILGPLDFGGEAAPFEWDTISPRVGLTWALGEERKTLLRASLAQFPEQLSSGNISRLNPIGDVYATFVFIDENDNNRWDGDCGGNFGDGSGCTGEQISLDFVPPDANLLTVSSQTDPGLDPSMTQEFLVGIEHALLPEFVVGVNLTLRNTTDVLETRTLIEDPVTGQVRTTTAADYVVDGSISGTLPDGSSYNVPTYAIFCGSGCRTGGSLLLNGDREVNYEGLNLTFIKRLSNQWMLRGYFNFGEGEWDVPQSYIDNSDPNDDEQSSDNDGEIFAVQAAGSGAKANVFIQSGWQYNINGMYQVAPDRPWGFNVAANIFGREGTPLPAFHRTRRSDGISRDIAVSGFDQFRSDDIMTVDLRLEKEFAATGNVGFTLSLDEIGRASCRERV